MTIYTTICQDSQSRTIAYRLTLGYHALATACSSIDQSRIIIIIKLIRMRNIYAYRATCTILIIGWRTSPSSLFFCLWASSWRPRLYIEDSRVCATRALRPSLAWPGTTMSYIQIQTWSVHPWSVRAQGLLFLTQSQVRTYVSVHVVPNCTINNYGNYPQTWTSRSRGIFWFCL